MSVSPFLLATFAALVGGMEENGRTPEGDVATADGPGAPTGPDPVYPAEFYVPFQPQTALDMLERTPGFLLAEGSAVRGFGGAAGNVLIDGQRPTVKGGGVREVLRRIAAARVERVVLLRGTDAAEAQGQTLVANVVLRSDSRGSGNASLTLNRTDDGRIMPSARINHARRIGDWQANFELFGEVVRFPSDAVYLDRDAAGTLTTTRVERNAARAPEYGATASLAGGVGGGTLTANLRLNGDGYHSDRTIDIFSGPATGPSSIAPLAVRTIAYAEDGWSGELGVDWTRRLGSDWSTKLVALGRIERDDKREDYAEPAYRGLSLQKRKPMELVARATLSREGDRALRPELGFEIAYNRLASHLDYAEDTGAGLVPVALSNAETRAAELRGEAFANATLRLTSGINLEGGMAAELSRIRVTGGAASEQSLFYLKPSAAIVWSAARQTQLRVAMRRTVDQLDFGDFAASVDQADGRPLGGNSGLRPARITRALARLDHRWGQGGALAVELFHQWHDGVLGYLILPSGDEALGTIGDGRQWGVSAQASLPLAALLHGARLTLDGTLRASRLRDLVTGAHRALDDLSPRTLTAEFRQDIEAIHSSWGVKHTAAERGKVYYTGEVLAWRNRPVWSAYVETTALAGFKTTLSADAVNGQDSYRLRRFFRPSRAGSASGSEERDLRQGATLSLTIAKAF